MGVLIKNENQRAADYWRALTSPPRRRTFKIYEEFLGWSDYGRQKEFLRERRDCAPVSAHLVSSEIENSPFHAPCIDIDYPAALIPSSTPGHFHLYLNKGITWRQYKRVLRAMMKAGLIEKGYYKASVARKGTHLRLPWVKKEDVTQWRF